MPSSSSSVPSTTHFFICADLAHALSLMASSGPGPTACFRQAVMGAHRNLSTVSWARQSWLRSIVSADSAAASGPRRGSVGNRNQSHMIN